MTKVVVIITLMNENPLTSTLSALLLSVKLECFRHAKTRLKEGQLHRKFYVCAPLAHIVHGLCELVLKMLVEEA